MPTPRLEFQPLTPARWPDLVRLFGPRGAAGGCWCMWPRQTARDFRRRRGAGNGRAFRAIVRAGPPPGVLAYADGAPVGWCAVAPRSEFVRLTRSRVMAPVDDAPVWSVVCFFVARSHRGRGLTVRLLREAAALARRGGARIVEGYPVDARGRRAGDAFVWTGLAATFRAAGFREVVRRSPTRPVMRRRLRPGRPREKLDGSGRKSSGSLAARGGTPLRTGTDATPA